VTERGLFPLGGGACNMSMGVIPSSLTPRGGGNIKVGKIHLLFPMLGNEDGRSGKNRDIFAVFTDFSDFPDFPDFQDFFLNLFTFNIDIGKYDWLEG